MVELPSGDTAYTRAGSFQISADGDVVTADGYVVFSENVHQAQLAAFLLAARGLDAAFLEEPVSQAAVSQINPQPAESVMAASPAANPISESSEMSEERDPDGEEDPEQQQKHG